MRNDKGNREALCQVLRMYDVSGKLLNGIKSMYVNILACVKVTGGENKCFRNGSRMRQNCIIHPWFFSVYIVAVMKREKMGMGRI